MTGIYVNSFLVNRKTNSERVYITFVVCLTSPSMHLLRCRIKLLCSAMIVYSDRITLFEDYERINGKKFSFFCFNLAENYRPNSHTVNRVMILK